MPALSQVHGVYILGTGLLAEEFLALLQDARVPVAAFVENLDRAKAGTLLHERPVIWVDELPADAECLCALSTTRRSEFVNQVKRRARFPPFVHPSSVVLPFGSIGAGSVVSTGVLLASHVVLGAHVFLNRGVRIGHHTRIGDYTTVQPGANIAGAVQIGSKAYIGIGAIIRERLTIGSGAIIAAGAVVTHDAPGSCLLAGNPAVVKRRNVEPK